MALFRGVALLLAPLLARPLHVGSEAEARGASPQGAEQGLFGDGGAEAGAVVEVLAQRSDASSASAAVEGTEDAQQCPIWCRASKKEVGFRCTYMGCSACQMCAPAAGAREAPPQAEPRELLGGRGAAAEVAAPRSDASGAGAVGEGERGR